MVKDRLVARVRSLRTQVGLVLDKDLRELRSHVLHGLNLVLDSFQLMDCLTMSFACAEVVLGVPLTSNAMAGEREGRRGLEVLLRGLATALTEGDADWFSRYAWFLDLVTAMLEDAAGKPLDE